MQENMSAVVSGDACQIFNREADKFHVSMGYISISAKEFFPSQLVQMPVYKENSLATSAK